jgi:UDP-3-O-[3-hydroxymyristoyl] glucosamine N-acyltransferase
VQTSVRELAALVGGRIVGDPDVAVTAFAGVERAGPGDVSFVAGEKFRAHLLTTAASAVVTDAEAEGCPAAQIVVADANLAFARLVAEMRRRRTREEAGVAAGAHVDPAAEVHPEAVVRPGATVAARAKIGARTRVGSGAYVGERATVGEDCVLHPNATVLEDVRIGDRCIIHAGAVLGADGFGFATDAKGEHQKIPQVGTVVVEDDVEIGANTCVDRARFDETRIGRGTKIDNLVQVAHNVVVGPHCLLVAQAGIAGSSRLGRNVVVGGMSGVTGHVEIGDFAQVSAMSGVSKDLEGKQGYLGVPAKPYREGLKIRTLTQKLPELFERLRRAEERLAALEGGTAPEGGAP